MKIEVINNANGNLVLVDSIIIDTTGIEQYRQHRANQTAAEGDLSSTAVTTTLVHGDDNFARVFDFVRDCITGDVIPDQVTFNGLPALMTEEELAAYIRDENGHFISTKTCSLMAKIKDNNLVLVAVDDDQEQPGWIISNEIYQVILSHLLDAGLVTKD